VVPGVAARIVGRRRQASGRERRAPVGLALKIGAVAARAMDIVDRAAERDLLRLAGGNAAAQDDSARGIEAYKQ
jgi:hypothetical protein